jgi:hypothetical protein
MQTLIQHIMSTKPASGTVVANWTLNYSGQPNLGGADRFEPSKEGVTD